MTKCCKNCLYHDKETGDCRRFPPHAQMIPTPEPDMLTGRVSMRMAKWTVFPAPNKEAIDKIWCGEYIAKPC